MDIRQQIMSFARLTFAEWRSALIEYTTKVFHFSEIIDIISLDYLV